VGGDRCDDDAVESAVKFAELDEEFEVEDARRRNRSNSCRLVLTWRPRSMLEKRSKSNGRMRRP
jgi:hypothetical protein